MRLTRVADINSVKGDDAESFLWKLGVVQNMYYPVTKVERCHGTPFFDIWDRDAVTVLSFIKI